MKSILNKYLNKENILVITLLFIVLFPVIELDYLAFEFLNNIGIPRLTTIVRLVVFPLLGILLFFRFEDNKKRFITITSIYLIIFGIYFVLHCNNAINILNNGRYSGNFIFNYVDEIMYFYTLLLPLFYIMILKNIDISEVLIKKLTLVSSCVLAIPIFISNIFVYSMSTYGKYTIDNIFSWFTLPYNETINHPRLYASKFFFDEANALGIILLVILPLLYYFFLRSNNKKERIFIGSLIVVQSLAMIILSSRIATYGAILIPIVLLIIYFILIILKQESFKKIFVIFTLILTIINGSIIPFSPAYQNQKFDATNHGFIMMGEKEREEADDYREEGKKLEEFSEEWLNFYSYMFEVYSYMIGVTPPIYYTEWYPYRFDPGFWVDLIFDYHLYDRINGRQIQQIFMNYKYDPLTIEQKSLGMGYGTFMRGSMILEKDFKQQFYTLGYVGFVLVMCPWIIIALYLGVKLLFGYKKGKWNLLNILLMMIFCITLLGGYMSGHVMDEFSTSMLLAVFVATLYRRLK